MNAGEDLHFSGFISGTLSFLRRHRIIIGTLFIISLSACVILTVSYGTSLQGSDAEHFINGQYNLTVSPTELNMPVVSHSVQFQVYGSIPKSDSANMSFVIHSGNQDYKLYAHTISNDNFTRAYVTVPSTLVPVGSAVVSIEVNGNPIYNFVVNVHTSIIPVVCDILIATTFVLYIAVLAIFEFRSRWLLISVIPVYLVLSSLFGQRYDTFFMMSSGIRLLDGVDPFYASGLFPSSLKWEYPPLFLPYSILTYLIAAHLNLIHTTNSALNFPGTVSGFTYMAWRALNGPFLLSYYAMIKVPMILATLGSYLALSKFDKGLKHHTKILWLLNPLVIIVGVSWGQIDVISSFFMISALLFLRKKNTGASALMCSLGTSFKVFPVFLLPGIIRESSHRIRDIFIFLAALLPDFAIYFLSGSILQPLSSLIYSRAVPTFYGVFSTNGLSWQNLLSSFGVTSFPSLFIYAFIPFYLAYTTLFLLKRDNRNYTRYLIVVISVFFLTYNYLNPQYFIWMLPLSILAGDTLDTLILSAIPVVYMFLDYNFASFINPFLSFNYFSSPLGQIEALRLTQVSVLMVPLILLANVYFLWLIIRNLRKQLTPLRDEQRHPVFRG